MKKDLNAIILTRQELEIMKVVWDRGAATVKEVCEQLCLKKPTAYTTVLTLMGILEDKGVLAHTRLGRAYIFRPLLSRQQATSNQVRDILTRFFEGKPEKLIANVLEHQVEAQDQISGIQNLLEGRLEHHLV